MVCGSFGLGAEGRLLACAQCGQCYHPFCVGIKVRYPYYQLRKIPCTDLQNFGTKSELDTTIAALPSPDHQGGAK